jgi:prevent-host-death family protein
MEKIRISEFRARCCALLEKVKRSGQPILITKRGEPVVQVVPPIVKRERRSWLGSARGTGRIVGDIVTPITEGDEEARQPKK